MSQAVCHRSRQYGGWRKTFHFSVSKYVLTGLAIYDRDIMLEDSFVVSLLILWTFLL